MSELIIVVGVRNDQTMSQYGMPSNGKLTFHNAGDEDLVVTPKSGSPFCASNKVTVIPQIVVEPDDQVTVRICTAYSENEFLYTARIGQAAEEDPIVILERAYTIQPPKTEPTIVILERKSTGENLLWGSAGLIVGIALAGLVLIIRCGCARGARPGGGGTAAVARSNRHSNMATDCPVQGPGAPVECSDLLRRGFFFELLQIRRMERLHQ